MQRQYPGTAGRVKNCQVRVFLACHTVHSRTFLDRTLYLHVREPSRPNVVRLPEPSLTLKRPTTFDARVSAKKPQESGGGPSDERDLAGPPLYALAIALVAGEFGRDMEP
jgi:hypothetical protein